MENIRQRNHETGEARENRNGNDWQKNRIKDYKQGLSRSEAPVYFMPHLPEKVKFKEKEMSLWPQM